MKKSRDQGSGIRDQVSEAERHEAATEEPAFMGCPSLMPRQLPSGFDGVEPDTSKGEATSSSLVEKAEIPSPTSGEDAASPLEKEKLQKRGAKLFACNERSRARVVEIAHLANECLLNTNHPNGYEQGLFGKDYQTYGRAIAEIRKLVRESIADVAPDYEMLALQFARNSFDFSKFQEALAAVASMKAEDFPGVYYTPGWLCELAKKLEASSTVPSALSPTGAVKGRLFKGRHVSSCHGTYIYDYVCINGARLRATLHPDNGGLEQHATIWVGDSPRCFCYCTFNTTSPVKCDYVVRGMIVGLAKRIVYHHKNLIKRKAAAKAEQKGGAK